MSTANFLCGYCNQLIAVSRDHLGQHVECPHCQQVVQAPLDVPPAEPDPVDAHAPEDAPAAAEDPTAVADAGDAGPVFSNKAAAEKESIFSSPDEDLSDDVFGEPQKTAVEMPTEAVPNLQLEPSRPRASEEPTVSIAAAPLDFAHAGEAASTGSGTALADAPPIAHDSAPLSGNALPRPKLRHTAPAKGGYLGMMLLIFLIPYALVTTGCVAYLIYLLNVERTKPAPFDPLERLPDPNPKEGGPKRVKHDEPLPDKLKTALGRPLTIGDLEVTPLAVERQGNHLLLRLKFHNVSTNTAFDPLPKEFVLFKPKSSRENRPYTFLQVGEENAYGGVLDYKTTPKRPFRFDGVLQPGEISVVSLETTNPYDAVVNKAAKFGDKMLWRVQVRRGFVDVKGKDVSATALFGVEFRKEDIADGQVGFLTPTVEVRTVVWIATVSRTPFRS